MLGQVNGNYELRFYVIDLDETYTNFKDVSIDNFTEDEKFIEIAEQLGTVYSLGAFIEDINNQDLDNFSNSYVRAILVSTSNEKDIIPVEDFNSLYLYSGEIKQV